MVRPWSGMAIIAATIARRSSIPLHIGLRVTPVPAEPNWAGQIASSIGRIYSVSRPNRFPSMTLAAGTKDKLIESDCRSISSRKNLADKSQETISASVRSPGKARYFCASGSPCSVMRSDLGYSEPSALWVARLGKAVTGHRTPTMINLDVINRRAYAEAEVVRWYGKLDHIYEV